MKTKEDISYGVIPYRYNDSKFEILLICQNNRIGNNSYWGFPKGHPNPGENPEETSRREMEEETGLKIKPKPMTKNFEYSYEFIYGDEKIIKKVIFFLGQVESGKMKLDEDEVEQAVWLPLAKARERLTYQATKSLLDEVSEYIKNNTGQLLSE
jgi:ADP-ribose pyrophosphatase YjhB (NUDIX family)